jgi:ABC-type microcin C transport system permease subunit YejB
MLVFNNKFDSSRKIEQIPVRDAEKKKSFDHGHTNHWTHILLFILFFNSGRTFYAQINARQILTQRIFES